MTLTFIIILALLGLVCLLIEILIIPGIGFAGIIGTAATIGGVYLAHTEYGGTTSTCLLVGEMLLLALLCALLWNSTIRRRLSLNTKIDSHVNDQPASISVGDTGIAITRLNLFGKAQFPQHGYIEVKALSFIDQGTPVKVISTDNNTILVDKA